MPAEYPTLHMIINGARVHGAGRNEVDVVDPATSNVLGGLPGATNSDLDDALEAARVGFENWRRVPAYDRARVLRKAGDLIRERVESIAHILTLEQGKSLAEARGEITAAADFFDWGGEEGKRAYGRLIPSRVENGRQLMVKQPIGPVVAFSPWNFPAIAPARKIAAALGAGCSCILKPSEETPGTALAIAQALIDAGLPVGVLNVVFGRSSEISEYLLASPVVRKLSFTGSTEVGRLLIQRASQNLIRTTMELGGHAPVLVFGDNDIGKVATLCAANKTRNAGQVCVSPTRFYVQKDVYREFLDRFTEAVVTTKVGNGLHPDTVMGPLANARRQTAIEEFVADAEAKGAHVARGQRINENSGYFTPAAVLSEVPGDARVLTEEPFGPVAIVQPFGSVEDALEQANRLPFGLAAYAFTNNLTTATAVGLGIEAGVIGINTFAVANSETPFGGVRHSGHGSEGGIEGLDAYLTTKHINQV